MKLAYWVDGEVRPEERLSSAISASDRASSSNWKERVIVHVLYLEKRGNSPILPQTIWCLIPATDKEHCTCQVEKKNLLIRPLIHSPTDSLTHSSTHSPTYSTTHSLTHSTTHSPTYSTTHPSQHVTCTVHILTRVKKKSLRRSERPVCDHHLPRAYHSPFAYQPVDQSLRLSFALWTAPTRSFYRRKEKEQNKRKCVEESGSWTFFFFSSKRSRFLANTCARVYSLVEVLVCGFQVT